MPRRSARSPACSSASRSAWAASAPRCSAARRLDEHRVRLQVCAFLPAIGLLAAFLPHTAAAHALPAQGVTPAGFRDSRSGCPRRTDCRSRP